MTDLNRGRGRYRGRKDLSEARVEANKVKADPDTDSDPDPDLLVPVLNYLCRGFLAEVKGPNMDKSAALCNDVWELTIKIYFAGAF